MLRGSVSSAYKGQKITRPATAQKSSFTTAKKTKTKDEFIDLKPASLIIKSPPRKRATPVVALTTVKKDPKASSYILNSRKSSIVSPIKKGAIRSGSPHKPIQVMNKPKVNSIKVISTFAISKEEAVPLLCVGYD